MGGLNAVPPTGDLRPVSEIPTMVIGADTSHPPAGISHFPSTSAVVYSVDANASNYRSIIGYQAPRQELITGLRDKVVVSPPIESYWQPSHLMAGSNPGIYQSQ